MNFEITSALPTSPLLLEASAGTGKTWAIAALTTRFLAETDTGIDEVLLITFTERAARDLRSRVFERIRTTEADLTAHLLDGQVPKDAVSALLASHEARVRRDRLREALANFDRAIVSTIHSFCEAMLKELGVLGDWDSEDQVLADPRTLVDQCATDVYIRTYADVAEPTLDPRRALQIARAACETTLPLDSRDPAHTDYCEAVRELFAARKRTLGVVTFDDMPLRLRSLLMSPAVGGAAVAALRSRFRLVMVDEFQDTDPVQWDIIHHAFMGADRSTVLIGDPKQSIYGFRNADLLSYLKAADAATKLTLRTNYRSDASVVLGVGELFGNVQLGDPSIRVQDVGCHHATDRMDMMGFRPKVLVRRARERELGIHPDVAIARDVVMMTRRLLEHATIEERPGSGKQPLRRSDIAVLVRSGAAGTRLLTALQAAGIPAVAAGQENVLSSHAATEWAHLLAAMASGKRSEVVLAACTDLLGFSLADIIDGDGRAAEDAFVSVRQLAAAFEEGRLPSVLAELASGTGWQSRVVALPDGERRVTDLLHIGELLAAAPARDLQELIDWFANRRADGGRNTDAVDHRMASDADAVRVLTMHSAKGLEFPVVLLPEVSNLNTFPNQPFPFFTDGVRRLYVGPRLGYQDETRKAYERQQRDEELRLLYVGLTRACHMAICWHVDTKKSRSGPLTALLARDRTAQVLADGYSRIPEVSPLDPALVSVSDFDAGPEPERLPAAPATVALRVSSLTRTIDSSWRRTSYSGLTAGLHEFAHSAVIDEPDTQVGLEAQPVPVGESAQPSPMAHLAGGAAFGTLVHAVFEELDWTPPALEADAARVIGRLAPRYGLAADDAAALTQAVIAICQTPLGELAGNARLTDLPLQHRLAELDFDLPLADRGAPATVGALASLLAEHLSPDDPLSAYPAHLAASPAAPLVLNGLLTGSIDIVLRTSAGRFVVVDYKTNRLPVGPDEVLSVAHYHPQAMAAAMITSHYPLQALLYCVALHRYLSWRLPGYSPDEHLGGVGYLFVRGMAGADTPVIDGVPAGVFTWFPPVPLVLAASETLGGVL